MKRRKGLWLVALTLVLALAALAVFELAAPPPAQAAATGCWQECVPLPDGGLCCNTCCRTSGGIVCTDRACP